MIPVAHSTSFRPGDPDAQQFVEFVGDDKMFALRIQANGVLLARAVKSARDAEQGDGMLVALLYRQMQNDAETWFITPRTAHLGLNGMSPPLQLATLEPGALVSIGERFWMTSVLWTAKPIAAPADLADKHCPVCGGELKLAPVVRCLCGRWMHLERPDAPDDTDALNCFLEGGQCGSCGRPANLESQVIPEPSGALVGAPDDDDVW